MMKLPVRVEGSHRPGGLSIRVEDGISGVTLLDIVLTPEQAYSMFTAHNRHEHVEAKVLPPESYHQKVGKTCHLFTRYFPKRIWISERNDATDRELREWGESMRFATGATSFGWTHHNNGTGFTMRLYENDVPQERLSRIQRLIDEAAPPEVLKK